MRKYEKGSFTVEAAVLVPFLSIVVITFIYLAIYVYDKTLMVQDCNAVLRSLEMDETVGRDNPEKHPYIAIDDLKVSVYKRGTTYTVNISGHWKLPVWSSLNRIMTYSASVEKINPIDIMFLTEKIREGITKDE